MNFQLCKKGVELKRMFVLFSHKLTEKQERDVKESLGVLSIIYPPWEVQRILMDIPAQAENVKEIIKPVIVWLESHLKVNDYVLIQGEFGTTFLLVDMVFRKGGIPIYSTTKRYHREAVHGDNVIIEKIFEHERFRVYEKYDREGVL